MRMCTGTFFVLNFTKTKKEMFEFLLDERTYKAEKSMVIHSSSSSFFFFRFDEEKKSSFACHSIHKFVAHGFSAEITIIIRRYM